MTLREEEVLIVLPLRFRDEDGGQERRHKSRATGSSEMILCRGQAAEKLVHAASRRHKIGPCYGTFASTLFAVIVSSRYPSRAALYAVCMGTR